MSYWIPTHVPEHYIYDVFFNDENQLIVIVAPEKVNHPKIQLVLCGDDADADADNVEKYDFAIHACPHKHSLIYFMDRPTQCVSPMVSLSIDGIDPKFGYLNHYAFLNKAHRGRDASDLEDTSITRFSQKLLVTP